MKKKYYLSALFKSSFYQRDRASDTLHGMVERYAEVIEVRPLWSTTKKVTVGLLFFIGLAIGVAFLLQQRGIITISFIPTQVSQEEQLLAEITKVFSEGMVKKEGIGVTIPQVSGIIARTGEKMYPISGEISEKSGYDPTNTNPHIDLIMSYYNALRTHDFTLAALLDYDKTEATITKLYTTLVDIRVTNILSEEDMIYSYVVIITDPDGTKTYRVKKKIVDGKLKTLASEEVKNSE